MRSPIALLLALVGMAITVVLVLLLFGNLGMRSELDAARGEMAELRAEVESLEPGLTDEDLGARLDELEESIAALLVSSGSGGSGATPGTGGGTESDVAERLDEIIERIDALDDRIDEICENVPVC